MTKLKHNIPLGTRVSFAGDPHIYKVADYHEVHLCAPDCPLDHDHYPEPYICVSKVMTTCFPLNNLKHIFDLPHHLGRLATLDERTAV